MGSGMMLPVLNSLVGIIPDDFVLAYEKYDCAFSLPPDMDIEFIQV